MDIRITNTCNSNCIYCLEQSLRKEEKFIDKHDIFRCLESEDNTDVLSFYGGNPLLHPDIVEIISYAKKMGFSGISLLTNTYSLDEHFLDVLVKAGLNSMSVYFHSFDIKTHNTIVNGGIPLKSLLYNIRILSSRKMLGKIIIHTHQQNIRHIYRDIVILYKKYAASHFDFVNYFPFDRPYEVYRNFLDYDIVENRKYIDCLFKVIETLNIDVNFLKFSKNFFGVFTKYYSFESGILEQIGLEDRNRLSGKQEPFCFTENRCNMCFIKDNCKWYDGK